MKKHKIELLGTSSTVESDNNTSSLLSQNFSSANPGNIAIETKKLSIQDGAGISVINFAEGKGGNLTVNASDSIQLIGTSTNSEDFSGLFSITSNQFAEKLGTSNNGDAGNLNISTKKLIIRDGAIIDSSNIGQGNAGEITIRASDVVRLKRSGLFADTRGSGDAGKLTITTKKLTILNSLIGAGAFSEGKGGTIDINASESIELIGAFSEKSPGGLTTQTQGTGNAGDLMLDTDRLIVRDGASVKVSSTVLGSGDAGSLTINTKDLIVENAQIGASTFSEGDAGKLEIIASESIEIIGTNQGLGANPSSISAQGNRGASGNSGNLTIKTKKLSARDGGQVSVTNLGTGDSGNLIIQASELVELVGKSDNGGISSGIFAATQLAGNAGDLNVTTEQLIVRDGAEISANSKGEGSGGNLFLEANSLTLNDRALIRTSTEAGKGGNITLQIDDNLILRNNSLVSARAFKNANGGNVTINANEGFILAFPNQNNDIIANASQGRGGNINISTQALFGLEERRSTPPNQTNDIDASSEFGLQGNLSLNTPDFDPTTGLIDLPASVGDASDQISQNPCEQGVGSEFIVTGKGGLPPTVNESLNSEEARVSLIEAVPSRRQGDKETGRQGEKEQQIENLSTEAVPAMGWVFNERGEVTLTAYSTSDTKIHRSGQQHRPTCSSRIAP